MRAINLYCDLMTGAILDGLQVSLSSSGVDIGAAAEPVAEELPAAPEAAAEAAPAEEAPAAEAPAAEATETASAS